MPSHYKAPVGAIISGEQGMLYGKPVLGSALNVSVEATNLQDLVLSGSCRYAEQVKKAVESHTRKKISEDHNFDIRTILPANISPDFDGVIAAEIVATTALIYEIAMKKQASQEVISNIAFQAHKKIFPQASGFYTSLSSFGGLIYFRKEFEFLKGIYKLPYKIPENIAKELCIDLSVKEDVYNMNPKKADMILMEQEKRTKRAVVAIVKEDAKLFFDQFEPMNKDHYPFSQSFDGVVINNGRY